MYTYVRGPPRGRQTPKHTGINKHYKQTKDPIRMASTAMLKSQNHRVRGVHNEEKLVDINFWLVSFCDHVKNFVATT